MKLTGGDCEGLGGGLWGSQEGMTGVSGVTRGDCGGLRRVRLQLALGRGHRESWGSRPRPAPARRAQDTCGPRRRPRSAPRWPLPAAVAGAARAPSPGGEAEEARWRRRRREPRAASAPRARPRALAPGGAELPPRPHCPLPPAPPRSRAMPG